MEVMLLMVGQRLTSLSPSSLDGCFSQFSYILKGGLQSNLCYLRYVRCQRNEAARSGLVLTVRHVRHLHILRQLLVSRPLLFHVAFGSNIFSIEEVLHMSPLLTAVWFIPMCLGGLILATVGGLILHLLPGTV